MQTGQTLARVQNDYFRASKEDIRGQRKPSQLSSRDRAHVRWPNDVVLHLLKPQCCQKHTNEQLFLLMRDARGQLELSNESECLFNGQSCVQVVICELVHETHNVEGPVGGSNIVSVNVDFAIKLPFPRSMHVS